MSRKMIIRNEEVKDYEPVESLTRDSFWNVYCSGACEHYLLHVMRQCPAFVPELDFVAELDGKIVGNVVFVVSHIDMDDGERIEVLSMGPIAVAPEYQCQGIGMTLVAYALSKAAHLAYPAVLLCGEPRLYAKYGFEPAEKYAIRDAGNNYSPALHIYWLKNNMSHTSGRYHENKIYEVDDKEVEAYDKFFPYKEKISGTPSQLRFDEIVAMAKPFENKK